MCLGVHGKQRYGFDSLPTFVWVLGGLTVCQAGVQALYPLSHLTRKSFYLKNLFLSVQFL